MTGSPLRRLPALDHLAIFVHTGIIELYHDHHMVHTGDKTEIKMLSSAATLEPRVR